MKHFAIVFFGGIIGGTLWAGAEMWLLDIYDDQSVKVLCATGVAVFSSYIDLLLRVK